MRWWTVTSCCCYLVQLSESFLIISTTSIGHAVVSESIITTRRYRQIIQQKYHSYRNNVVNHDGRITILSSQQQQNTIEKKEKQLTTKTRRKNRSWEESFQLLRSYKEQHGNCNVPYKYKDDSRLGYWVSNQRRRKETLSDDRIVKLNDLGFSWTNEIYEEQWEESFQLLVSYKERYGNCNVPNRYEDDLRLGNWVDTQRQGKEKLSHERIEKLDDLGFSWANEINEDRWEEMFEKLQRYAKENNGDCNVPGNNDNNDVNKELYIWVSKQRVRKSLISKECRTKLDNLGLIWEDSKKVKDDQKWNEQYEQLQEYKQKYGHCRVPEKWEEDPFLGRWVSRQRKLYRKELLPEDRQMKLEEMDFTWKVRDAAGGPDLAKLDFQWFVKFGTLLNFLEENGHCDVPYYYKKDKSLAKWVYTQRQNQKNGTLREERKEMLDDIGLTWSFDDQKDEQWTEKYQDVKRFKEQNGHLRLPRGSILSNWAYHQRVQFAAGKVPYERKALLDEINFRWDI